MTCWLNLHDYIELVKCALQFLKLVICGSVGYISRKKKVMVHDKKNVYRVRDLETDHLCPEGYDKTIDDDTGAVGCRQVHCWPYQVRDLETDECEHWTDMVAYPDRLCPAGYDKTIDDDTGAMGCRQACPGCGGTAALHDRLGLGGYGIPPALLDIAVFGTAAAPASHAAFPGYHGNKELEFLGDRVLKLVHGEWIAEDLRAGRIAGINPAARELEMNRTFRRYLREMGNICELVVDPRSKACANIFEAVVGCLYTVHSAGASAVDAIQVVKRWLETETPAGRHRAQLWTGP